MQNSLHYPVIKRQKESAYHSNRGEFYADSNYQDNYEMVAKDCQYRCVYCDATEKECGGERFSLDHFRPRAVFKAKFNGILIRHPYNLHLSCQKCNVLKSDDWQGCTLKIDGATHVNGKGYVDRFKEDIFQYIEVDKRGRLMPKQISSVCEGPGRYMINRLHLNRPNRVYLRQVRHVKKLVENIEGLFAQCTSEILEQCQDKLISAADGMERIEKIENIRKQFMRLRRYG